MGHLTLVHPHDCAFNLHALEMGRSDSESSQKDPFCTPTDVQCMSAFPYHFLLRSFKENALGSPSEASVPAATEEEGRASDEPTIGECNSGGSRDITIITAHKLITQIICTGVVYELCKCTLPIRIFAVGRSGAHNFGCLPRENNIFSFWGENGDD